jgi:hypothetical protein
MPITAIFLFLFSLTASARDVEYAHDVANDEARDALVAAGFNCSGAYGIGGRNWVILDDAEKRDPLPTINAIKSRAQRKAERLALINEVLQIRERFEAGTDSAADRRRALMILLQIMEIRR